MKEYNKNEKEKKNLSVEEEMNIESKVEEKEIKKNREESPAKMETTGPETKNGIIVNTRYVKVRREPKMVEGNVLDILGCGDKVKILEKVDGFYKVSTNTHKIAYISSDFIKEE